MFLMETHLPTPMTARVYVNLLEGNHEQLGSNQSVSTMNTLCVSENGELHGSAQTLRM